jgi:hypothetical protein
MSALCFRRHPEMKVESSMGTVTLLMLLAWLLCTAIMTFHAGADARSGSTGAFAAHGVTGAPAHNAPADDGEQAQ